MIGKKALIVYGGWDGHTPEASANIVADLLKKQGYQVALDSSTDAFADPDLKNMDLIVPALTMTTIEKEELQNLLAAVRGGSGLAGFHGLMCDTFRNEPEYQFMTGGQWVAHPGDVRSFTVDIAKPEDPIMSGISSFSYLSEQYYMHVDPSIEVLATTTFDGSHFEEIDGVVMPVIWKRRYGKGRIFYSALGHIAEEFKVDEMQTIFKRGALWASR